MKTKAQYIGTITFSLLLLSLACLSEESADATKVNSRITEYYSSAQVSSLVVDMEYGLLFFRAGEERYVWRPGGETLGERLEMVFYVVDRVDSFSKIEIGRWPHREGTNLNSPRYRGGELHHSIDEVELFFE